MVVPLKILMTLSPLISTLATLALNLSLPTSEKPALPYQSLDARQLINFGIAESQKLHQKPLNKCQNTPWFIYSFFVDVDIRTKFE